MSLAAPGAAEIGPEEAPLTVEGHGGIAGPAKARRHRRGRRRGEGHPVIGRNAQLEEPGLDDVQGIERVDGNRRLVERCAGGDVR